MSETATRKHSIELTLQELEKLKLIILQNPETKPKGLVDIIKTALGKEVPAFQIHGYRGNLIGHGFKKPLSQDNIDKLLQGRSGQEIPPNKAQKEAKMEKEELQAILDKTTEQATAIFRQLRTEEKKSEEEQQRLKKTEELLSSIKTLTDKVATLETKTGDAKNICEAFPGLCTKVEGIEKKLSEIAAPPAPPNLLEKFTDHKDLDEIFSCPGCLAGHIKKVGYDKAAEEICKDDEECESRIKAIVNALTKKGFKITKEEIKPDGQKKEDRPGFHLGK